MAGMRFGAPVLGLAALAALATACSSAAPHRQPPTTPAAASPSASAPSASPGILTWVRGQGGRDFERVGGQLKADAAAPGSGPAATARGCTKLAAFISKVQQDAPVPDATAQRYYALALTNWQTGAADCQAGATASDAALLKASAEHFNAGSADFAKAARRILALIHAAG